MSQAFMNKYIRPLQLFFQRYNKQLYYIIPILAILILAFANNFFYIDKKVINRESLWDMTGRPYNTFLYELNLPGSVGAVFVAGTPDNLEKTEKYYNRFDIGDIFTSQLRSLLGKKITVFSISAYINFVFGFSAVVFSILAGYFIFKNGYISIPIFLLIVIFRNFSQGLIYGLPLRHTYAVFNPLLVFCIVISLIIFLRDQSKKYLMIFILPLSGFLVAYIAHIRTSEGQIDAAALIVFAAVILLESLRINRKNFKKMLINVSILFVAAYVGYLGYYKMVAAFESHRDKKFNLTVSDNRTLTGHPAFHSLYVSLFRYETPNRYGDKLGYDAVYEKHPEIKKKFSADVNYIELSNSEEYHKAIKEVYFDFIFHNPKRFLTYLARSAYDYFLFLPYYSWTGNKSAHAYLPKINDNVEIEPQDLAPDFKDTSLNWILNLKLRYLPNSMFFWLYFIGAYAILIEAIYTSFINFKKNNKRNLSVNEVLENKSPIYLLWGMLIYFFFTSVVRILIPVHGQSAVVAFNIIVIYNLARIVASIGIIETKKVEIPAIKMPAWSVMLIALLSLSLILKSLNLPLLSGDNLVSSGEFENNVSGWVTNRSVLYSVEGGQSGNCLKIIASENATGYAYIAVPTEIGGSYKFTAYFKRGTAGNGQIKVGTAMDVEDLYYSGILSDTAWTQYSGVFKAVTPITYITLVNLTSVKGQTSYFDKVSIAESE